ncbi:MAG: glycosyltransferase family 2 protein [Alphaproteobacteria bacterium]|nr:glycosyltransferase family 2 protein [Alphaproteobacteria bacterium]
MTAPADPAANAAPAGIAAVMVSYRTGPVLARAIAALRAEPALARLVIVDNGNPADVVTDLARIAADDPRVRVLSGHGNIGFAAACNRAVAEIDEPTVLLINPDCVVSPGALESLAAIVAGRARPWLIGCRLVNEDGSEQRGARREILTPATAIAEALHLDRWWPGRGRIRRLNLHETALPDATTAVPSISGAFMLMPAADYRAIGGMDEGYFLHVEDLDFCLRFGRAGGTILFVPDVVVTHHQGSSASSTAFVEWHKAKGFMRYFRKNFGASLSWPTLAALGVLVHARMAAKVALGLVAGPRSREA